MDSSPTSTSTATVSSAPERVPPAERIARNERGAVVAALLLLGLFAWLWTVIVARTASSGATGTMAMPSPAVAVTFAMWWLMMVAMMLPSAAPAILLYGRVRRQRSGDGAIAPTGLFLAGYLLVWAGVAVVATSLQLMAVSVGLIEPMALRAASPALAGAVLIAAGLYQLLPLKDSCLTRCRSPAEFLSRNWRSGAAGALRLGVLHGAFCIGCCWLLMALLFVGGVMNLAWIAALSILVAAEKLIPRGPLVARVAGIVLILWGMVRIVA